MTAVPDPEVLFTAEQFALRPDPGYPEELVQGRIVAMPMPKPHHESICNKAGRIFGNYVEEHRLGRVLNNDTGVMTRRDPDTVRGAAIAYYSYQRLPEGEIPDHYAEVAPELVVEVRSPGDRWPSILAKVAEYLEAGVSVVVVLDYDRRAAHLFADDGTHRMLGIDDELTIPELLGEFRVLVRTFFD